MNDLNIKISYSTILDTLTNAFITGQIDRKTLDMLISEFKKRIKEVSQYNILENVRRDSFD